MKDFSGCTRIRVTEGPLKGICGTVARRLISTPYEAWVTMDERPELANCCFNFPVDDPNGRGKNALLCCESCEKVR
jgi:hypothetical protein